MPGGIGFYVHHHGQGHAHRTQQIIRHLEGPVTVFGSSLHAIEFPPDRPIKKVLLPLDTVEPSPKGSDGPDVLHYAPLAVPGIRERMFLLAQWIRESAPSLLIVDVSVEVTLFARLMGVPTVVMRQNGVRNDPPHRAAFQSSEGLLAPYASTLEDKTTPDWVRNKTFYAGGFSRYSQRSLTRADARHQLRMKPNGSYVVVMNGLGGTGNPLESVVQAAPACPSWEWWVVGPTADHSVALPDNVKVVGRVDDTFPYLKGADVVVASAGNNTVMEIATAGTPYVCIPEARPFREQVSKAEVLNQLGAAVVLNQWPEAERWPELLERVTQTNLVALAALIDPDGARNCARYITAMKKTASR